MDISFNNPWILLLIPITLIFIFYFSKGLNSISKVRRRSIIAIRSIIMILLILALSGVSFKTYVDTVSTIFAVDLSESTINNQDQFKDFINEALKDAAEKDKIGVVTFGQRGEVEIPLLDGLEDVDFETNPGRDFTNIQKGLMMSQALLPENTHKRIVLLTDGEENIGDSIEEGSLMEYNNIDLKIYKTDRKEADEVQLKDIKIPKILHENQSFDILLEIYSNVKTKTKITLYSDRNIVGEKDAVIEKGTNRFVFRDNAGASGFKSYRAVIMPVIDSIIENNSYSTFTEVKGKPRILLVDGDSNGAREIEKILDSSDINITHLKDRELPSTLSELIKYNSIIMCDVSLEHVNNGFINSLKSYVRDYGGGLLVTGGENSFALGGYYKTPLEEVLPVDMEMKIKGEIPSLGLMLVIDKSGSMGGQGAYSKIEIAKEAAIKALDSLKPNDKIGVVAFDGAAQWVVEFTDIQNKDKISDSIGTIRAGGGTSIIPALNEAYLALKDVDSKLKHIILLTDGQAERTGYYELLDAIRDAGITVSTVAVGEGSDEYLLKTIADEGKGRYYFVDDFTTIPHIFTKETFLSSGAYLNNRTFTPAARYFHEIINPLNEGVPSLDGYISTSSKDRAETILISDKEEPILATWQYGLGRSVAWTSDLNGRWNSGYLAQQNGIDFIKNMVEWTLPRAVSEDLLIETKRIDNFEEIIVNNIGDFDEEFITKATIINPDNEKKEIELIPVKPGEYRGEFDVKENGVYIIKANQYKDDDIVNTANYGIAVNYSKEYDITSSVNRLDTLVNKAQGKFINNPKQVFVDDFENIYGMKDISRLLTIIALFLFIIDIAIRRLNLRFYKIKILGNKVVQNADRVSENIKTVVRKGNKLKPKNLKDSKEKSIMTVTKNKDDNRIDIQKDNKKASDENNNGNSINKLDTSRLLKAKDKRRK